MARRSKVASHPLSSRPLPRLLAFALPALAGRWSEARIRWRARPLLHRLEAAGVRMTELSGEIETRFLACGEALRSQVGLTARLTKLCDQLVARDARVRSGDAAVLRVAESSTRQLALAREFGEEVDRLSRVLSGHAARLQQLQGQQQQIERSFAPIRALQSLFRIESATLTDATQALFHGLAQEMMRLEREVRVSFETQDAAFEETRGRVVRTATNLQGAAERHRGIIAGKNAEIAGARGKLENAFAAAGERNLKLQQTIRAIERETDAIVLGLQYQDITRQRLEHVRTAARDLQTPAPGERDASAEARRAQVLCRIQTLQLRAVQDDLNHASRTVGEGLRQVLGQLQAIEQDCLSVSSLQNVIRDMDAMAAETVEAHRVSAALMKDSFASLEAAIDESREFAAAASGASDAMRRLAGDIHLMGLNAQVQAVHANSRSLEVLSRAASQISQEAQGLGVHFEDQLIAITRELTTLIQHSETFRETTRHRLAEMDGQGGALLDELRQDHEVARNSVQEVVAALEELHARADDLLRTADLAEFSREPVDGMHALFGSLSALYASGSHGRVSDDDPLMGQAMARYTMESERTAHVQAVSQPASDPGQGTVVAEAASSGTLEPAAPVASGGAGLGDNVELF